MNKSLLKSSDKEYWHRFTPIYEKKLQSFKNCKKILEFGVFKGDSVRWLNELFPNSKIYGCDILDVQAEWPIADNIEYLNVDQGKIDTIKTLFKKIGGNFDLIIEDGSHYPEHQKNCLTESLKHISSGGLFILEDIHTSHPEHSYYKNKLVSSYFKIFKKKEQNYISALHLLLCIEHLIKNNKKLDKNVLDKLSVNSLFSKTEITFIFDKIEDVEFYKRASLPHKCYSCLTSDFDYHNLKCKCGTDLYSSHDSMTALITIK